MNRIKKSTFIISCILITNNLMATEEPKFKLLEESDNFQIREYSAFIVAEMIINGEFEEAGNDAFSTLVGYIGGKNISQESIEMTAPVNQEKLPEQSQEIEMTAPVAQEKVASGQYRISFVMPDRFTLATLPKPEDERVQVREVPAKKMAVIKYSGTWSEERYKEHETLLYSFVKKKGYQITGNPIWARYDPPFMPWFMRRNEIMIEIK